MKRRVKKPERYGEWEEKIDFRGEKKENARLWEVEDVLEIRGEGEEERFLVKWKNWDGPASWIDTATNPEIVAFVRKNSANPHSCTLNKTLLNLHAHGQEFPLEVLSLKQSIFDILGDGRRTPDGAIGHQSRVTVKVPFSKETFDCTFRNKGIPNIENDDSGNVDCHITVDDVSKVLGEDWMVRGYKTSTETFVSKRELIHLWWGYKPRINYCHIECQRCHWFGIEEERPQLCTPSKVNVPGPAWIHVTFTRSRRNIVTGDVARKSKCSVWTVL